MGASMGAGVRAPASLNSRPPLRCYRGVRLTARWPRERAEIRIPT
jgi:hypothetical protein